VSRASTGMEISRTMFFTAFDRVCAAQFWPSDYVLNKSCTKPKSYWVVRYTKLLLLRPMTNIVVTW